MNFLGIRMRHKRRQPNPGLRRLTFYTELSAVFFLLARNSKVNTVHEASLARTLPETGALKQSNQPLVTQLS